MIMIDFDGCMADLEKAVMKVYNQLLEDFNGDPKKKWDKRVKYYDFSDKRNKLDPFFVGEAFKRFNTYDMTPNTKMIPFIDRLEKEGIEYRVVTARTHNQTETLVYLDKWFHIDRNKVWFVPVADKHKVFHLFDYVIEDNPACEGDNVYLITHSYNAKHGNIAMRGKTEEVCRAILDGTSHKRKQTKLIK